MSKVTIPSRSGTLCSGSSPMPAHTIDHRECPACAYVLSMRARPLFAEQSFPEAAAAYRELRGLGAAARYLSENTHKDIARKLRSLELFFQGMRLGEIRWFHLRGYQEARLAGAEPFVRSRRPHEPPRALPCKPQQINKELGLLVRMLELAGCWTPEDGAYFEYLRPQEEDTQRALTPEEQQRWLDTCRAHPRWNLILWYSLVAFDTLMSTNEIRGLRLGDINLRQRVLTIPWASAKNRYRHRTIPLEHAEALWALEMLEERAQRLGCSAPMHYLFPFKVTRSRLSYPERPMTVSGIKGLWNEVRQAAQLPWFRAYDTRHTGATRYAEAGVPTEVIVARLGHCGDAMRRHYTHISQQAQRSWLRNAGATRPPVRLSPDEGYRAALLERRGPERARDNLRPFPQVSKN